MKKQQTTNNIAIPNKDLEILKKHFSNCFDKGGNFDIEKFKKELSKNEIDFSKEGYGIDWLGKNYARLIASDNATTLLKGNKDWNKKDENKMPANTIKDKVLENDKVIEQVVNNSKEQAMLGGFSKAIDDAVIGSLDVHQGLAKQVLDDERVRNGFAHIIYDLIAKGLKAG